MFLIFFYLVQNLPQVYRHSAIFSLIQFLCILLPKETFVQVQARQQRGPGPRPQPYLSTALVGNVDNRGGYVFVETRAYTGTSRSFLSFYKSKTAVLGLHDCAGFSLVAAPLHCSVGASRCSGFFWVAQAPGLAGCSSCSTAEHLVSSAVVAPGLSSTGSTVVVHGLSCSTVRGIFPDQGSNLCLLCWQADSLPLIHHGSP